MVDGRGRFTRDAGGAVAPRAGAINYKVLWFWLLLGWTVSAADRTLTGPVVTWMIEHDVGFLAGASKPHALGGLIGGLFFAGYMLTQWPGGYLGDKYGHRTVITVSLVWAGIATLLSGLITGLVLFIAIRVLTGLGEGAFYSNDRSLIARDSPPEKRSLGMGVVITGLAIGITLALVFTPDLIKLGGKVFSSEDAWRMTFLAFGAFTLVVGTGIWAYFRRQERGLPYFRAALHLGAYAAVSLAAVMAVYFIGDAAGLSELAIAGLEVALAVAMGTFIFMTKGSGSRPVVRSRDHWFIAIAFIAVLWNLWFFSFWSVSIVADAAHSSFGRSAMVAAFNAGAGILGFPAGGWLADAAVRRGIGRKGLVVSFTIMQCLLTVAFGYVISGSQPSVWTMALLLFAASAFFNAMQPMAHAMLADITPPEHRGSAFGMNNLVGEIGAVLAPAVAGTLRDATGNWTAAVYLDAGLIAIAAVLFMFVRESEKSHLLRERREGAAAPAGAPREQVGATP
jgi:MFS transporter, ACS family, D-galactonate transporter